MAGNRIKCYICQRDTFMSKKEVIKHIRGRHPDHVGNKMFQFYVKSITEQSAEKVQTQNDMVSKLANTGTIHPDKPKVTPKEVKETSQVNEVKEVINDELKKDSNKESKKSDSDDATKDEIIL